jgi:Domain of unknown function (DUF4167)
MRSSSGPRPPGRYNGNRPFQQQPRPPQRGQTFESNGPSIKIRGNAHQIFERYVALAREAATGGDPIAAENFYQHAEHYFRITNAGRDDNQQRIAPRLTTPSDVQANLSDTSRLDSDPTGASTANPSQPRCDDNDPASAEHSSD